MVITMEIGTFFFVLFKSFLWNSNRKTEFFPSFLKRFLLLQNSFRRFQRETNVFFARTIFSGDSKWIRKCIFFLRRSTQCSGMCWCMYVLNRQMICAHWNTGSEFTAAIHVNINSLCWKHSCILELKQKSNGFQTYFFPFFFLTQLLTW